MKKVAIWAGKSAKLASRLHGSGGSALPGFVVEKIQPDFLQQRFASTPVIVISGTNGKTTTAKIVTELLQDYGLKVFTNKTGSNFTRGIISATLDEPKWDFDLAVLELDEAHAVHFVRQVTPTYTLLLNVLRDQLDRFGEIDTTAGFLRTVAAATTKSLVLNREDPLVSTMTSHAPISYFGYSPAVAKLFPSDDELYGLKTRSASKTASVVLESYHEGLAKFNLGQANLTLPGAHNALNAAAALAMVKQVMGHRFNAQQSLATLSQIQPAFGRGETVLVQGRLVSLILVKNPSGFRSALASQLDPNAQTMIAINDHYADGRDMSWLWDVDFRQLKNPVTVSGIRATDMALRLQYDEVKVDQIEPNLTRAVSQIILSQENLTKNPKQHGQPVQIFCTYTAMLKVRKVLQKLGGKMERII